MRRNTKQQAAVRDALNAHDGFVTVKALYASLQEQGSTIGLATVYRVLSDLVQTGEADWVRPPEGEAEAFYRACTPQDHHHHLICRRCGRTVELHTRPVEKWMSETAAEHGFTDTTHMLDIFGLCRDCARADASTPTDAAPQPDAPSRASSQPRDAASSPGRTTE